MIDAILQTKLHPPLTGSASLVQRQRLLDRLDRTFHCKLAVVAAPAGYGKSTLALAWKERLEQPVAWLSLDEDDNDPRRFITYVVAALNYILPEFGTDLLHLLSTAGQELPIESISTVFLNQLSKLEMPTVLVLDDYHVLELPAIHEIVAYWLEHLPPALHLLLVSRSQPDLPLSRLRAGGQLVEIDQQALRFTRQETDDWLRRIQGIMLTDDEVNTLTKHTEGWPAGICLAALSLQDAEDRSRFVATFSGSNRLVVDYLVDEVLDQRSPETREFLLKTSILDRLTGSLCDALLQEPDQETGDSGQRMLEKLDATGLFILPLDNERR